MKLFQVNEKKKGRGEIFNIYVSLPLHMEGNPTSEGSVNKYGCGAFVNQPQAHHPWKNLKGRGNVLMVIKMRHTKYKQSEGVGAALTTYVKDPSF